MGTVVFSTDGGSIQILYLKVHYATFLRACKQRDRALDAGNSSLQELT